MLYIKKSSLPHSGKGLFTDKFIKRGTRIVEYTGDIISYNEYDERVQKNHYGYLFYINKFKNITEHAEILVGYGAGYWRDIKYNKRLEAREKRKKLKKKNG